MNFGDELIEEFGYVICPLCFPSYVYCDEDCDNCDIYREFKKSLEGS